MTVAGVCRLDVTGSLEGFELSSGTPSKTFLHSGWVLYPTTIVLYRTLTGDVCKVSTFFPYSVKTLPIRPRTVV